MQAAGHSASLGRCGLCARGDVLQPKSCFSASPSPPRIPRPGPVSSLKEEQRSVGTSAEEVIPPRGLSHGWLCCAGQKALSPRGSEARWEGRTQSCGVNRSLLAVQPLEALRLLPAPGAQARFRTDVVPSVLPCGVLQLSLSEGKLLRWPPEGQVRTRSSRARLCRGAAPAAGQPSWLRCGTSCPPSAPPAPR